eukprot:SAG31_NODE_2195_length_6220_cov_9.014703_6_plen_38_part_00
MRPSKALTRLLAKWEGWGEGKGRLYRHTANTQLRSAT